MTSPIRLLRAGCMALGLLLLSACAGIDPARYAAEQPALDMRQFFNGTLDGYGMVRNRAGEVTRTVRLNELSVSDVDMLTVVIIGATTTRMIARPDGGSWVYTPRGYERKTIKKAGAAE